jgi:hypothetical protein
VNTFLRRKTSDEQDNLGTPRVRGRSARYGARRCAPLRYSQSSRYLLRGRELALEAHQQGVELNYLFDAELPERVRGDATRLGQILSILLSHTLKFNTAGDVFVEAVFNYPTLAECYKVAALDGLNRVRSTQGLLEASYPPQEQTSEV